MADFRTANQAGTPDVPVFGRVPSAERSPVSRLLAPRHRPHVAAFYQFLRLAREIADDPLAEPDSKISQLDALERALVSGIGGPAWLSPALKLKQSLSGTGVSALHARQMLQAHRRDVQGGRCQSWSDLMLHCRYSANPIGRHLLELHGESPAAAASADALTSALKVLTVLIDLRHDWVTLGRCHLPIVWFRDAGADPEHLVERKATEPVRVTINRALDHVDQLLTRSANLPRLLADPGLRLEAAIIRRLAKATSRHLRSRDPLAERVTLPTLSRFGAVLAGVADGLAAGPRRRPAPPKSQK